MQDDWQLPEDWSPELKKLFNEVMEPIMSYALRHPEAPRAEIVRVVEMLLDGLKRHWELSE